MKARCTKRFRRYRSRKAKRTQWMMEEMNRLTLKHFDPKRLADLLFADRPVFERLHR